MSPISEAYRYIVRSAGVRSGNPIIEGTRVAVHDVIGLLQNGVQTHGRPSGGYESILPPAWKARELAAVLPAYLQRRKVQAASTPNSAISVDEKTSPMFLTGGSSLSDIVKVTVLLVDLDDLRAYRGVREEYLPHRPAGTLLVAKSLAMPELLFEVDAIAVPDRA